MTTVFISAEAEEQFHQIDHWWRNNRLSAPNLFVEEFESTIANLERMPRLGRRIYHPEVSELRRIFMNATRYHLYYLFRGLDIVIIAIWSATSGNEPKLKPQSQL